MRKRAKHERAKHERELPKHERELSMLRERADRETENQQS